eukprot:COSAG02_NODE_170_length_31534_cov_33.568498_20_plen_112_part_00
MHAYIMYSSRTFRTLHKHYFAPRLHVAMALIPTPSFELQIGHQPTAKQLGSAKVWCNDEELRATEGFPRPCPKRLLPPFPSNPNYDAKAWRFVSKRASKLSKDVLFWNVAA